MSSPSICPKCGAALPPNAPKGLCPRCLLSDLVKIGTEYPDGTAVASATIHYFGDYELLGEIAHGGMGVVYRARQISLDRPVALKMILAGKLANAAEVARFHTEAEATARLDHPNIVPIYEIGEHEGRHYFSMKLIEGGNLAEMLPGKPLTPIRAAGLLTKIARAVHYAHQRGILHRDLKPTNILLDRNGEPYVTDFGLARLLEAESELTGSMAVMGSANYISPEQAAGRTRDLTTATDLYSLGAILYESITGRPPFRGASLIDTLRQVAEKEPESPQNLNREVDRDLATICLKCLQKEPQQRYGSAEALADDLQRFMADEPVIAAVPSAGYRFRKFARRNKAALGIAAAMSAVLIAATIVSTWHAVRATKAENHANSAREESEAVSAFLNGVFQSPDPARDGRSITVAETLDRAVQKLDTDLASQPARRARLQGILGWTFHTLDLEKDAIPLLEKARDYFLATVGPEHRDTLAELNKLAVSYHAAGRQDEAIKMREMVLTLRRKVLGPEDPDTLAAMHNLSISYGAAGRPDEALKLAQEMLGLSRKVLGPGHLVTLSAMHLLAICYDDVDRKDEALTLRVEALERSRQALGAEHPETLLSMNNLGLSYREAGHLDESVRILEEVLLLSQKVNGPEHADTIYVMHNLSASYRAASQQGEALKLAKEVLALRMKVKGEEHPDTLWAMNDLALCYHDAGRREEALDLQKRALELGRKLLGPEHPGTLEVMELFASACYEAGRLEDAVNLQKELLDLRRKVLGNEHQQVSVSLDKLGEYARVRGDFPVAEVHLLEAWRIVEPPRSAQADLQRDLLDHLVQLYEAWSKADAGRSAAAAEWKQKLIKFSQAHPELKPRQP